MSSGTTLALALLPAAYLLGCFPSAVLVARSKGVDITAVGSGNPGASNVARALGTRWGIAVFALDGVKGAIPALAGVVLDSRSGAYALAAAAVVGHMFPATRRFRGGKGVATTGGAILVLHPIVFAVLTGVWVAARRLTDTASVGSIVIALGLPVGIALAGGPSWEVAATAGLAALVMLRHSGNIRRLATGNELTASADKRG